MSDLTPDEKKSLDAFIDAVAAIGALGPQVVGKLSEHVDEHGTDHEDGLKIDIAVKDCLDIIRDSYDRWEPPTGGSGQLETPAGR